MSKAAKTADEDFSEQLKAIVIEAGQRIDASPAPRSGVRMPPPHGGHASHDEPGKHASESGAPPAWMRPVMEGIEALNSAYNENALRLNRIEKTLGTFEQTSQLLNETRQALEQRNVVSRLMFEALHAELKGYKDVFMLEAVLRPVIRDLISLYDDMVEIHRQTTASVAAQEARGEVSPSAAVLLENVQTVGSNLEHNLHFILEVLERMEVTLIPEKTGKLDKRTQRAVALEIAESQEQDQSVIRVLKRGFTCGDRVVRPEEVVILKWKEGSLVAINPASAPQSPQVK